MTIGITTGPRRNWANIWKPLIDAFGPVLGEHPEQPFHPNDDRITSLGLHHNVNSAIGHDVIITAWWINLYSAHSHAAMWIIHPVLVRRSGQPSG
jgi:hypothetical protein